MHILCRIHRRQDAGPTPQFLYIHINGYRRAHRVLGDDHDLDDDDEPPVRFTRESLPLGWRR